MQAVVTVTVDALDPDRMATFWAAVLGYEPKGRVEQYRSIVPAPPVSGPKFIFQGVDSLTPGKNRWHLDLDLDDPEALEPEVERILGLGATRAGDGPVREFGLVWYVLHDPEGSVFCVVAPDAGAGG